MEEFWESGWPCSSAAVRVVLVHDIKEGEEQKEMLKGKNDEEIGDSVSGEVEETHVCTHQRISKHFWWSLTACWPPRRALIYMCVHTLQLIASRLGRHLDHLEHVSLSVGTVFTILIPRMRFLRETTLHLLLYLDCILGNKFVKTVRLRVYPKTEHNGLPRSIINLCMHPLMIDFLWIFRKTTRIHSIATNWNKNSMTVAVPDTSNWARAWIVVLHILGVNAYDFSMVQCFQTSCEIHQFCLHRKFSDSVM